MGWEVEREVVGREKHTHTHTDGERERERERGERKETETTAFPPLPIGEKMKIQQSMSCCSSWVRCITL